MAVWYDELYVGQGAVHLYPDIYKSIETKTFIKGVYLITLASGESDQLDVYDSYFLNFSYSYRNIKPIIGIALGQDEAYQLVRDIAADVYKYTGGLKIRKYFEDKLNIRDVE